MAGRLQQVAVAAQEWLLSQNQGLSNIDRLVFGVLGSGFRWWQGVSGYCGGLLGTGQVNIVLVTIGLLWDILEIENRMSPNACIVHSTMYST